MVTIGRSALVSVDLVIAQGADFSATLRYRAGDPAVPVDLTGWHARAQIRERPAGDVWATISDGHGITLSADGTILIEISHTQTNGWGGYYTGLWDLLLISPSGQRIRLAEGSVSVSREITSDA